MHASPAAQFASPAAAATNDTNRLAAWYNDDVTRECLRCLLTGVRSPVVALCIWLTKTACTAPLRRECQHSQLSHVIHGVVPSQTASSRRINEAMNTPCDDQSSTVTIAWNIKIQDTPQTKLQFLLRRRRVSNHTTTLTCGNEAARKEADCNGEPKHWTSARPAAWES